MSGRSIIPRPGYGGNIFLSAVLLLLRGAAGAASEARVQIQRHRRRSRRRRDRQVRTAGSRAPQRRLRDLRGRPSGRDRHVFSRRRARGAPQSIIPPPDRSGSAFASNDRADDGRLILIVLDDIQVSFTAGRMATVKSVARRTVERLGPADLAGVMTTSGRLGGQTEFTKDKSRLIDAIERFVPQGEHDLPAIADSLPSASGANPPARRTRRAENAISNGRIDYRGAGAGDDSTPAKGRAPDQPGLSRLARRDHSGSKNRRRLRVDP